MSNPPEHNQHRYPFFLPDGKHFLFYAQGAANGIYIGSLESQSTQRLLDADTEGLYILSGHLLFVRQGILLAQRFDAQKLQIIGEATPVAEAISYDSTLNKSGFSVGRDILAYRAGTGSGVRQLVWFNRQGQRIGAIGAAEPNNQYNPSMSPDGLRIALDRGTAASDIWVVEAARGVATRLTFDKALERAPVWSPDGSRIVFSSNRKGIGNLFQKLASGSGAEDTILESEFNKLPLDWSPDGQFLLYRAVVDKTGYDLLALPLSGDRKPAVPVANTAFEERDGQFSPDGKWVAWRSNESGRFEVYVQPFPGPGGKAQISTAGGTQPRWRRDGKELFYISLDSKLMAVPITVSVKDQKVQAGTPAELFATRIAAGPTPGSNNHQYVVSPDGQRFLINVNTDESITPPITLILNWNAPR